MNLKEDFLTTVKELRVTKPIVLHLTNYVSMESCADITLAAGASPYMITDLGDVQEAVKKCDAVVINLGTLTESQKDIAIECANVAQELELPVILDPCGVMCSTNRLHFALDLLEHGLVSIVRGNMAECSALLEEKAQGRGLDVIQEYTKEESLKIAKELAAKFGVIVAATGAVDYISDGKKAVVLNNGNPLLKDITGAGCMTSSLVGCCAAVTDDYLTAAALGVVIMGQSAELAANFLEKKDGPGMFKVRLMDAVYHITTKFDVLNLEPNKL